jgi:pseudaminic acid biosynthesis-associated methylase
MQFKTEQEEFWAGNFGVEYIDRNIGNAAVASNLNFFSTALKQIGKPKDLIEFGANIGNNLQALKLLYPGIELSGVEINATAAKGLEQVIGEENVSNCSIFNYEVEKKFQTSLIKGVLIHINPDMLELVYQKLYDSSNKYILIAEYYNPSPVAMSYRGNEGKLFKRDFAGEMLDKYSDLELIDYGFCYRRDPAFPHDDFNWFLLRKEN